ncbi:MAG TPA: hypothetical protein VH208_04260 [Myxococcaceae bacterium]|nr:hypothetical protein [Myxococcaceae bacterium]
MGPRLQIRVLLGALAIEMCGCPGRLEDPVRFTGCPAGIDVQTALFGNTCGASGCHNPTALAGGLDLASAGVSSRVINHASSSCPGQVLISSPDSGFLFDKLLGNQACGSRMPLGLTPLTHDEIVCVESWAAPFFDGGA